MLYDLTSNKKAIVAQIVGYNRYYLTFTRPLNDILHQQLLSLYGLLANVTLNMDEDIILWRWSSNHLFTTNYCYSWLMESGIENLQFQSIWAAFIPLKIKIFFMAC
jgi:hypothetical protein